MGRTRALIGAGAAALLLAGGGPPAAAQSLADTLVAAYRASNLLDQNRALLRAADEDVAQAVAALRPVVSFVAQAQATAVTVATPLGRSTVEDSGASLTVTAELTLYDGGANRLALEAAQESVLAAREGLRSVEQQVLLGAVVAFVSVRNAAEVLAIRQNNLRVIEQELRAARDRFEVGEITRTDVAIAEARLAAARSALAAAEGDLAVARESYRAATGALPGVLRPPPPPPATAASAEAARDMAVRRHPSILRAQREVRVAELNVGRAATAFSGRLTAGARAVVDSDESFSRSLSLSYSVPLYRGGELSSLHRQAIARRDATSAALHQTAVTVVQDVGRAWAQLAVARASLEASERQIAAARTAFEGVREEATLGARTTLDVLNAEQELLDARAARVAAESQQYIATYTLLAAMGLLTVDHLGLGIPTYDPEAYFNAVRSAPVTTPQGARLDRVLKAIGRD